MFRFITAPNQVNPCARRKDPARRQVFFEQLEDRCVLAALLIPGDNVIAIDADISAPSSSYFGAENPANSIDGTLAAKYLNLGGAGSGLIVTPVAASVIGSFVLSTANDSPERDPSSYMLFGTNDPIVSTDNSNGAAESWTLIDEGPLSLPGNRLAASPPVNLGTSFLPYTSYKLIFPTLKYAPPLTGGDGRMQIGEVQFYTGAGGTGSSILAPGNPILAIDSPASVQSVFSLTESPSNILDGNPATKYLNYGGTNSGLIVTPFAGPSIATSFTLTTANDAEARDPASYQLFGTNDNIISLENTPGTLETWTLLSSGALGLPAARSTLGPTILFANST